MNLLTCHLFHIEHLLKINYHLIIDDQITEYLLKKVSVGTKYSRMNQVKFVKDSL